MAAALPPELVRLFAASNNATHDAAWADFVRTHNRLLLHVARAVGRDYDAAMDAYAHVLEQLRADDCRRLRAYAADGRSKFTTWLVVVARRLCLDHYRQRYGRAREADGIPSAQRALRRRLADLVTDEVAVTRLELSPERAPDAALESREISTAVAQALGTLAPRDRLLLALRFEQALSAREIATIMGFPTPFHVYRRLNSVLAMLRGVLGGRGIEPATS